uniref:Glutathione S-transferase sigma-class n=1 Tax=Solen grandis TaxID=165599 RepID=G9IBV2_9BIVA|nr:glutathione S-transferase sigma-class [Solen grandis]
MADKSKHSYKLLYFQSRGVAELIRLLFKVAEVDFEDKRYSREEWPSQKEAQPLKALPVLEVDGKKYCLSAAIARYLAEEFGLMGSCPLDVLRINEIQEAVTEMFKDFFEIFYEKDKDKKVTMLQKTNKETLPKFLDFYEKRLKENNKGEGWVVGDKLTLADLVLYNTFHTITLFMSMAGLNALEKRPLLQAHYARVEALPQIAAWIKARPETEN